MVKHRNANVLIDDFPPWPKIKIYGNTNYHSMVYGLRKVIKWFFISFVHFTYLFACPIFKIWNMTRILIFKKIAVFRRPMIIDRLAFLVLIIVLDIVTIVNNLIPFISIKFSFKIRSFDSWKADLWNAIPGGPAQMGALKKLLCRFHLCMKAWNSISVMLAAMSWSWLDPSQFAEGEKRGCMGGHLVPHQPPSIPPPCICRNCQKYFLRGKVTIPRLQLSQYLFCLWPKL